jgi:hypothetical protein
VTIPVRARVWKDRLSGAWCFAVPTVRAGARPTWEEALSDALAILAGTYASRP